MHQGNWKCGGCGGTITELPFEPRGEAGLMCKTCFSKSRNGGKPNGGNGEKTMHKGDWACNVCNKSITELPFQPRETNNLLCRDCFKESRA